MNKPKDDFIQVVENNPNGNTTIVIQQPPKKGRILKYLLIFSVLINLVLFASYQEYMQDPSGPQEKFYSGSADADDKIARIEISGAIMPANTTRILKAIKKAKNDDAVKGVVVMVDSPGGAVADSHQIYHRLKELSDEKPMVVTMSRFAASGGLYVAMGGGPETKIFAEPTTWTGSIGVIIPRYNLKGLGEKLGISSDSLKTGPFKDSLDPFRDIGPEEQELWKEILDEALGRFTGIIDENRDTLNAEQVAELATGRIFTADQALENGLIDEIGYEDDAITSLAEKAGLDEDDLRVVNYEFQVSLIEALGGSAEARSKENMWKSVMESTVPQAMYYCSWIPISSGF